MDRTQEIRMKAPNFKTDYLSWLSHSGYFLAIQCFFGLIGWLLGIERTAALYDGYIAATIILYFREIRENKFYRFWHWKKWDSVLDFVIPIVAGLLPLFLSFTFTA